MILMMAFNMGVARIFVWGYKFFHSMQFDNIPRGLSFLTALMQVGLTTTENN